jgi:hypothetical protein
MDSSDFKYLDLNTIDLRTYDTWFSSNGLTLEELSYPFDIIDVYYWDTYNSNGSKDTLLRYLLEFFTINVYKYGIKNFRTDNMTYLDFDAMINLIEPENYNNNWKTVHLEIIRTINPHWNTFYNNPSLLPNIPLIQSWP